MTSERVKGTLSTNPWNEYQRCIASIDLAKRPEVREKLLEADWDLVVVDEAHKCSARTDAATRSRRRSATSSSSASRRKTERLLLLTATPHQGNADQFGHFLRLLDEDQFIDLERDKKVIQLEGNPWYLRRMKEDLKDFDGQRLFTERHAVTQPFTLDRPEYELYEEVTDYINEFLPRVSGKQRTSSRWRASCSSDGSRARSAAITSTLARRHKRLAEMLAELESLPESERAKQARAVPPDRGAVDDEMELGRRDRGGAGAPDRLGGRRRDDRAAARGGRRARAARGARTRHAGDSARRRSSTRSKAASSARSSPSSRTVAGSS